MGDVVDLRPPRRREADAREALIEILERYSSGPRAETEKRTEVLLGLLYEKGFKIVPLTEQDRR